MIVAVQRIRTTVPRCGGELIVMINLTYSRLLLAAALCGFSFLGGCTAGNESTGTKFQHSGGTPVNPNTDPGGQGVPGSRSTGANSRQSPGLQ